MRFSGSGRDRILKELHPYLSAAIEARRLRAMGWFDFLAADRPESEDPVAVAAEAFLYLSIENSGRWSGAKAVLGAVLEFAGKATRVELTKERLLVLQRLLQQDVVDHHEVRVWFEETYRPVA